MRGIRSSIRLATASVTLSVLACFALSSNAYADQNADNDPEVTTARMALTGFNPEVAAQNGFEIRTTSDGRQFSVPVGTDPNFVPAFENTAPAPQTDGQTSARGIVYGDCGYSYVYLYDTYVNTGYAVAYGVFYSKWGVSVDSPGANDDINLDHGSTGPYWDYNAGVSTYHYGDGYAYVNEGSYAVMTNGGTCYSGLPSASNNF